MTTLFRKIRARREENKANKQSKLLQGNKSKKLSIFRSNGSVVSTSTIQTDATSHVQAPTIQISRTVSLSQDSMETPKSSASSSSPSLDSVQETPTVMNDNHQAAENLVALLAFDQQQELVKNYEQTIAVKDSQIHIARKQVVLAKIQLAESQGHCLSLMQDVETKETQLQMVQTELEETKEQLKVVSSTLMQCQDQLFETQQSNSVLGGLFKW